MMESNNTLEVSFEDPGRVAGSEWVREYLKPAIMMLLKYRKANKAIPTSNFKFMKSVRNDKFYWTIWQRVYVEKIIIPEMKGYLNES